MREFGWKAATSPPTSPQSFRLASSRKGLDVELGPAARAFGQGSTGTRLTTCGGWVCALGDCSKWVSFASATRHLPRLPRTAQGAQGGRTPREAPALLRAVDDSGEDYLRNEIDLDSLQERQDEALELNSPAPISGLQEADQFLSGVGIALRYGPTKGLPLASLYRAFAGLEPAKAVLSRAIVLTNKLLGEARAIEVHIIADRVTLVHRSLMPALYVLVRRGRALDDLEGLSVYARTAVALLHEKREVTAGTVRQRLGLKFDAKRDPAYAALRELAHLLLVDRGPFEISRSGIQYLSKEGYPYHLFHEVHEDLVAAAARYSVAAAAERFVEAYLNAAVFARVRKLAFLFKAFLSPGEIEAALRALARKRRRKLETHKIGRDKIVVYSGTAT
jgi:hypothetical protein